MYEIRNDPKSLLSYNYYTIKFLLFYSFIDATIWVDKEMVLLSNNNQTRRIATFKFLADQEHEVRRFYYFLDHSSHYCTGYELENVLPPGYSRPSVFETLWFSRGLWGLPFGGVYSTIPADLNCQDLFAPYIAALKGCATDFRNAKYHLTNPGSHPRASRNHQSLSGMGLSLPTAIAKQSVLLHLVDDMYKEVRLQRSELRRPC